MRSDELARPLRNGESAVDCLIDIEQLLIFRRVAERRRRISAGKKRGKTAVSANCIESFNCRDRP